VAAGGHFGPPNSTSLPCLFACNTRRHLDEAPVVEVKVRVRTRAALGFGAGAASGLCVDCFKMSVAKLNTRPEPLMCRRCGASRNDLGKRLPRGWKRQSESVYCATCWNSLYLLRAVALPVASPLDCGWKELRATLHQMWAATTQASNWLMTEFYARDVRRGNEAQMPAMPNVYLYPEARERFPVLPPRAIAALVQKVKRTYRAKRYDTIWRCAASLPTYRYPSAFSTPSQAWSIHEEGMAPVVSVRIGNRDIRLRLKSGARYRRQLDSVSKIIAGEAVRGELSIYQRTENIMCKFVAWLPRPGAQEHRSGVLTVRTSTHALIVAFNARDERIWTYNGDQIRRWHAEHWAQLQRWAEDTKAEHRPVPPFAGRRTNSVRKYHHRMETACHTIASLIVNYAIRRKFAAVRYDDSDRTYCEQFPWSELKLRVAQKCDAAGLTFEDASNVLMNSGGDTFSDSCATG